MGWSGGLYTKGNSATGGWVGDASTGIGIEAGRHDTQDNDFATGINQCINKDGSNSFSGNANLNNNKIVNVSSATLRSDAPNAGQVQDNSLLWGGTSGGAANAQTLTLAPIITAYVAGQRYSFIAGFTNTAAATLNINGVGAKNIFNTATGAAIGAGEIVATRAYEVIYDGTQFLLLNDVTPIQNGDYIWLGTTGGTATAMTASATPAITAYKAGQKFRMKVGAGLGSTGSTATSHTININGVGAKNIVNNEDSTNPTIGTWIASAIMELVYDGTNFLITNDPGGWLSFSPSFGVAGGGTSGEINVYSLFRKNKKTIQVQVYYQWTQTVVPATYVLFIPPVNAATNFQMLSAMGWLSANSVSGFAYTNPVSQVNIYNYNLGTFALGASSILVNGSYRSV